jgi:hypothetical protein
MDDADLRRLVAAQRGFTPLGLILRAVRGLLRGGSLVVASTLAQDPFDRVGLDSPGVRWMRFQPCTDERMNDPALADPPVRLDDVDADSEQRRTHIGFDGSGASAAILRKHRRIDTLFGSNVSRRQRLDGIVACERPDRVLRILRGSAAAWRADRPWIALPLAGGPEEADIAGLLDEHGYVVFDPTLHALDSAHAAIAAIAAAHGPVDWILALPRESAFTSLARALFGREAHAPADAAGWNTLLRARLGAELRSGGIRFETQAATRELKLPIDIATPRWGFHAVEYSEHSMWSWIGPRPRAGIVLPPLATRLERLALHVVSTIDPRNVQALQASLDGEPLQVRGRWHGDHGSVELTPFAPSPRWRPFHRLELSMPTSGFPSGKGDRMIALALSALTLFSPAA